MRAILALAVFCLTSCAGLLSKSQNNLVGEWQYQGKNQSCRYVFKSDGTFKGQVIYHAKLISKFTGRWSVAGDSLNYTYIRDALGRIPAGAIDRDRLLSVRTEFFVIEAADGNQRKYLRIR
jgi:hypothetical protein